MSDIEIIRQRHSVREYTGEPIEGEALAGLKAAIAEANAASDVRFVLVQDDPEPFNVVAKFGLIHGCRDCIACVISDKSQEVTLGYWGQRIVLAAQKLGLNTCWVGMFAKKKVNVELASGEKARVVIAIGHGKHAGFERKTKSIEELSVVERGEAPAWFAGAMEAAQLAPTALNAQNFTITLLKDGRTVRVEAKQTAFRQIDLGIVKCNFELAANELGADWAWERS